MAHHGGANGLHRQLAWLAWLAALALATMLMVSMRASLGAAHVVLAYLILVLVASAWSGRALGLTLAVCAFGCFNFFFVPPYHTFAVAAPLDWLVLGAFLVTSGIAAQLLARAQREATEARQRAAEVDRFAALGAEALNAARPEEALEAVAEVIRVSLGVTRCEVFLGAPAPAAVTLVAASGPVPTAVRSADAGVLEAPEAHARAELDGRALGLPEIGRLVSWVAEHGAPAAIRADGALRFGDTGALNEVLSHAPTLESAPTTFDLSDVRTVLLPLRVREHTVGVLALLHEEELVLDGRRRRFLAALAYYAALGAERVRLGAEAEHAEALREADRLKDALLASVSHDLRTPLTTIKALAHAIGAEGDERALTIEEEADRLNRFVADLLDLSRLAGGALRVAPELNTVDDLVGAALQRVSGPAAERAIEVSLDTSGPLLVGRFDFAHALRVLVNLIENALKYAPPEVPVEVAVRRAVDTSEWLEIVVADRGPGVPPAERDRIFEPFYRPSGSLPDAGSAGLGLSIARRLAEAQGGTLQFEARPGGGSRFVLRLPAADLAQVADLPLA
jgi:two-component system sensor histidine kinase KdpD